MADIRTLVEAVIGDLGTIYWTLSTDYVDNLPAIQIARDGGPASLIEREDRVTINVYAAGDADGLANTILERLAYKPHYVEGVGLIDNVRVTSLPHQIPFPDPNLELNSAEYRMVQRTT